jgi:hypothetical protein
MLGDEVHALWKSRQGVGTEARLLGSQGRAPGRADAWLLHEIAMSLSSEATRNGQGRAGMMRCGAVRRRSERMARDRPGARDAMASGRLLSVVCRVAV